MAYQNVSTPRFYIDWTGYNKAIGNFYPNSAWDVYGLTAGGAYIPNTNTNGKVWLSSSFYHANFPQGIPMPLPDVSNENSKLFTACLGNNAADVSFEGHPTSTPPGQTTGTGLQVSFSIPDSQGNATHDTNHEIVNYPSDSYPLNGFSIIRKTILSGLYDINGLYARFYVGTDDGYYSLNPSLFVKSVLIGQYYDMPVAPDLSLSLEHDYSGIKKTTSMSGASFSNANWIKPPKWGDKEAWQLGDFPRPYSGRRVWDLSFSYISDTDLEPRNYTGTKLDDSDVPVPSDDNWFDNILHYTMGGHLPFIFRPDKDVVYNWTDEEPSHITEIPELAICRFDMNSFSREQVAPGVYNIKVKIKESW